MRRKTAMTAGFAAFLALCVFGLSGLKFGDPALYPAPAGEGVAIFVVSNGFHSGLVLPRQEAGTVAGREGLVALGAVGIRFGHYDWIEIGWGEERFYRDVPSIASFDWSLALRALFSPGNASVMHVVGIEGDPRVAFQGTDLVRVELSRDGFARILSGIDHSFARDADGQPAILGQGLYGPSLFYSAAGVFNLFNLCNHWTARRLGEAGLPVWPLAATLPRGLILDLMLRAGVRREANALPAAVRSHYARAHG